MGSHGGQGLSGGASRPGEGGRSRGEPWGRVGVGASSVCIGAGERKSELGGLRGCTRGPGGIEGVGCRHQDREREIGARRGRSKLGSAGSHRGWGPWVWASRLGREIEAWGWH